MKTRILPLLVALLLWPPSVLALVEAGVGFTSLTSGRQVPALSLGVGAGSWMLSALSVGTQNAYSYNSGYTLNALKTWVPGKFLYGDLRAGFGLGMFYTERGFQPTSTDTLEKKSDFGMGPALLAHWYFLGPIYIGIDGIFGLKNLQQNLTLSYQDFILFSLGAGW